MSNLSYKVNQKTRNLVMLAMFSAILLLMGFTPIGFIKTPGIEITLMVIPVAIGAIMTGPFGGAVLGGVFGLISFAQCFGLSAFGAFILGINPVLTFVLCFFPRLLTGYLVGLVYKALSKKMTKNPVLPVTLSAVSCALINTITFISLFIPLFAKNQSVLDAFGASNAMGVITGILTLNALIEAVVTAIVGSAIAFSLVKFLPKPATNNKLSDVKSDKLDVEMLVWSIINTVLLFPPLGIVSIIFTVLAKAANTAIEEKRNLYVAKILNIIATVLGFIGICAIIIIFIIFGGFR